MAFVATAAVTIGVVSLAAATGPGNNTSVPDSAVPAETYTAGTPFSSGQQINIVIPANSVFTSTTQTITIVECTAPEGDIPTSSSQCDGNTQDTATPMANADGSFNYFESTGQYYTVYALPDSISLGETTSGGGPTCNASVECILYVGYNQNDLTQPHLWSQPFTVVPNSDDKGENPGDGSAATVPSTPVASESTVVASPSTVAADGEDPSTVTVTMLGDVGGNKGLPVPGKSVTLGQGSGHSDITPASAVTNSDGQAIFTVTDSTTETVTYTATDTTDSPNVTASGASSQSMVDFEAPVVDASHSTVVANPTTVASGGSTTITVTLRIKPRNLNLLPDRP